MVEIAHELLAGVSGASDADASDADFLEQALVLAEQLSPAPSVDGEGEIEVEDGSEGGGEGAGESGVESEGEGAIDEANGEVEGSGKA